MRKELADASASLSLQALVVNSKSSHDSDTFIIFDLILSQSASHNTGAPLGTMVGLGVCLVTAMSMELWIKSVKWVEGSVHASVTMKESTVTNVLLATMVSLSANHVIVTPRGH